MSKSPVPNHIGFWWLWTGDRWVAVEVWRFKGGRKLFFRNPANTDTFLVRETENWGPEIIPPPIPLRQGLPQVEGQQ